MEYLFVLAGGFALLFSFILFFNKGKQTRHWIFAVLSLLVAISCYYVFLLYKKDGQYYEPYFSELNYAIPLLYGVLLWFYTRALIKENLRMKWLDLLHFFPFVFFLGFLSYPLLTGTDSHAPDKLGYPLIKLIINPIYIFLILSTLRKHRKKLLDEFSYVDHMHHYWLNWIAYGALALWIVACIGNVYNRMNSAETNLLGDYFLTSFLAAFLFILAYVGFNRTQIFHSDIHTFKTNEAVAEEENEMAQSDEEWVQQFDKLKEIMVSKKPYLDPKLSLSKLAEICQCSSSKLSVIINTMAKQNFYEFVNSYRINEVTERMTDPEYANYSILGLAEESGFNSKASFNRIFKNQTGLTPSEYMKQDPNA